MQHLRAESGVTMAEAVSDNDVLALNPRPKRRRILDPSVIVPVPIYSSKVSSSLQLKPTPAVLTQEKYPDDGEDENLWSGFSSQETSATVTLSDSEEEEVERLEKKAKLEVARCHSPSPPDSPVNKHSSQFLQKIQEIDRKLEAVNSLLSPASQNTRSRRRKGRAPPSLDDDDDIILINSNDDDVVVLGNNLEVQGSAYDSPVREIPLKIRCRTDIHKIPVLSSTPLSDVVEQLSVILNVPPPRLLLMRKDVELPTASTVNELGLSIADIIECDVMAAEELSETCSSSSNSDSITVRLQSKDRASSQEFSLHRDSPLGSVFSQYLSNMSDIDRRKVRFHFDGSKVTDRQTPAQLDMEDGDIIEVWT